MSSELNSQSPWMKDLYTVNNPGEELKYYQQTAEDYERTLRGLKYRGTDILFIALKKFEEKTGSLINFSMNLIATINSIAAF